MIIKPTSEIANLPTLRVMWDCINFTDENLYKYTSEDMINSEIYIIFENEFHKVFVKNKPLNVDWLSCDSYTVNQFYINDPFLTNGKDIHLKFFVHSNDWIDSRGIALSLSYVEDTDVQEKLKEQINSKIYFPTVLINHVKPPVRQE
ncbi:hypothetical protein LZP46_07640 [Acinetobacter sp. SCLZS86]|uniref:hypothetical protein n=1 Tax=Acinetobacter sp. SCLZS86 TaxID=2908637 RepID=UPI001F26DF15|nr:hypothetical protein [Acinetobacter sp. SCLZS86]UIZ56301.1 hypothetical protein LZP46_07640 [Acinetobacter sp. SCLZS86]